MSNATSAALNQNPDADRLPSPYRAEAQVVAQRLQQLAGHLDWVSAARSAVPWVQAVRDNPPPFWAMESLLKEYPISSNEGLALMRLAEALLRVPDAETAIVLTADQLGRADFSFDGVQEPGRDGGDAQSLPSALSRLSSAAIALSKQFLPDQQADKASEKPGLFARLGARTVVAATLRAVQLLGRQFVLGQTIDDAMSDAKSAQSKTPQLSFSYDMLGEGARTEADAQRYLASYQNAIEKIAARASKPSATVSSAASAINGVNSKALVGDCAHNDGISIKLSALHPRYEYTQHARVMRELVARVWVLCDKAARAHINLTIDAEEVDRLELSLDVFEALAEKVAQVHPQWTGFGLALQAYQTRALELIQEVARIARAHRIRLMCRLVKGAYWDAEIKRAQEMGLPHYPVFTHKHHTDVSYLACAGALLAASDCIYPQFATHNAATIAAILQMAARSGSKFELQRLHGMGEGIYREVLKNPLIACRIYAPVGQHKDLLAYLVRRLLENGANSSFIHQLADESVGMDELLISPLQLSPQTSQPLPANLYSDGRKNSDGLDLAVASMRLPLLAAAATTAVPRIAEFDAKKATTAHQYCSSSYQIWSKIDVTERAAVLNRAADAMQADMPRLCAMLVKEAFKTWGDSISEVREAVDFLRYYAVQAQRLMKPIDLPGPTGEHNQLRLTSRGVWVCISPWNFPLAIFVGQVAAALATGNTVLAKPAEQTPAIAVEAAKLLHAAGVPVDALQICHGPGETVGAALVALPGIAGVVFTGSTQVAKIINRALAAKDGPITPLIAETGGINAMLVDSTALPEQVADAVVQSAFRSAGQRCSALRLLCVHEAIADGVLEMIEGAAAQLVAGDTTLLQTDVGPVIDREAYDGIQQHLKAFGTKQKPLLAQADTAQAAMNLIVPTRVEVARIEDVKHEIFGPVLHVVRYSGDPMDSLQQINALGYGLTLGIQTRIDSRAQQLARAAHVGNVYVNRNMIGAVVGVQPFGGEGLSGTGPKAGGPHYLLRFCAEQTVTINTTAAGGNVALLGGGA
jgi:RHH-type transcriptional regulator, proline utilization regulon repressor / proline dehydrogenase / delta 1-pyrroline-5-carboxylate dehydrogenase